MRLETDWTVCIYCGSGADAMDHTPPLTARGRLDPLGVVPFLEVPSCKECNELIGSDRPWILAHRIMEVKDRLKKKYGKILRIPKWSEIELQQMGPNMADSIRSAMKIRQWVEDRLRYRGTV